MNKFLDYCGSSFFDLVKEDNELSLMKVENIENQIPHATTIVSIKYKDGVIIAGDRRATEGLHIADRRIKKVYKTDSYSAMAIAGAAGPCIEMARLFAVELEHYEKIEGSELSMEGKANKLSGMIKANLPMAMQGLAVVPIFAGFDKAKKSGRIFRYDITGGKYEEFYFHATGSGGKEAKSSIKKGFEENLEVDVAVGLALEALYDAAEEDAGTGGPDILRNIFPIIATIDKNGFCEREEESVKQFYMNMLERKKQ